MYCLKKFIQLLNKGAIRMSKNVKENWEKITKIKRKQMM